MSDSKINLTLYDDALSAIQTEAFSDSYAANFFLQTIAKKLHFSSCLFVIHDLNKNTVNLSLAKDENSIFLG